MENIIFLKIEILTFILSLGYFLYFSGEKIYNNYIKGIKVANPKEVKHRKTALNKVKLEKKDKNYKKSSQKQKQLTDEQINELTGILKKVKVHSRKGYMDSAKSLIIEGLAIDKFNKELNLELAGIYEKEKNYKNAEYIYKDLIEVLEDNFEVRKKLGFILAMQHDFKGALDIYEDIHYKDKSNNEVVDMLADLTYNMDKYKKSLKYINLYLKDKPRNIEKMFMKCDCLENDRKYQDAVNVYKKILELQPYNTKARDKVKELKQRIVD